MKCRSCGRLIYGSAIDPDTGCCSYCASHAQSISDGASQPDPGSPGRPPWALSKTQVAVLAASVGTAFACWHLATPTSQYLADHADRVRCSEYDSVTGRASFD